MLDVRWRIIPPTHPLLASRSFLAYEKVEVTVWEYILRRDSLRKVLKSVVHYGVSLLWVVVS